MTDVLVMDIDDVEAENLGGAFRQGFLCPFCMQDLGDLTSLHAHVEQYHPTSTPIDYSIDHIKGIFDKARKKISHIDASFLMGDVNSGTVGATAVNSIFGATSNRVEKLSQSACTFAFPQDLGITRSHTDFYFKCRSPCINDAAVKTNSLIIRLDKLINESPSDSNKRKAFEREVVPWVIDNNVARCQTCSMKFSLTRRRHHCRLCKLTNPAFAAQLLQEVSNSDSATNFPDEPSSRLPRSASVAEVIKQAVSSESLHSVRMKSEKLLFSTLSLMKRDGTEISLASLLQQDENEHLRICAGCKTLLDIRNEKMEMLSSPPMLVVLYERLCSLFRDAQKLATSYARISESLSRGETMYSLDSAVQLRNRLMQLQKEIDSVSSRVETHRVTEENTLGCCTQQELLIRKNIRDFSLQILQRLATQMNLHPTEDRYNQLQEKRRANIEQRVEMERKRNAFILKSPWLILQPSISSPGFGLYSNEQNPKNCLKESVSFSGSVGGSVDDGWSPSRMFLHSNPFIEEEDKGDPLQEQILIIKGYLKQAVEDSRLEEAEILERNLCDLEREINKLRKKDASSVK
uniref:C2H2-type domain-containing protein n=1 Tax=Setaria digitata TaxID=48799 RepID=A0A915Q518_9BILA